MTNIFQGDPAIYIGKNGATLVFVGGQPEMDDDLVNQALIALFTEKGWPGNHLLPQSSKIGGDLEKLARGSLTLSKLSLIEKTAEQQLSAPIFGTVRVTASNPESWITQIDILIEPPGGLEFTISLVNNGQNWISQADGPLPAAPPTPPAPPLPPPPGPGRLYNCDANLDKFYEIDPDTLANLSGAGVSSPGLNPFGIGGIAGRLYNCGGVLFYEIDPDTLVNLSGAGVATPGPNPQGIGGITDRLYNCDGVLGKFYEIDPDTLVNLSGAGVAAPSAGPRGMGGITDMLYHCGAILGKFYEIDPSTLANLSGAGVTTPGAGPRGVGGIKERLYHCDSTSVKFYEIDPSTLANLSGAGVAAPGTGPQGIGGIK